MGIEQLYELRFNKLFQQFETLVREHAQSLDRDYIGETLYDDLETRQEELPL
jgi:hypothetical protein